MEILFTEKYQTAFPELPFGLGWAFQCKSQDLKKVKTDTLQYESVEELVILNNFNQFSQKFIRKSEGVI